MRRLYSRRSGVKWRTYKVQTVPSWGGEVNCRCNGRAMTYKTWGRRVYHIERGYGARIPTHGTKAENGVSMLMGRNVAAAENKHVGSKTTAALTGAPNRKIIVLTAHARTGGKSEQLRKTGQVALGWKRSVEEKSDTAIRQQSNAQNEVRGNP